MLMFALLQGFYIYRYAILTEGELPAAPRIQMNVIAGVFSALFVAISVYLVHFAYYDSPAVVNNTYNPRDRNFWQTKTTRGDILASIVRCLRQQTRIQMNESIRLRMYMHMQ